MTENLKRCPFCGGKARLKSSHGFNNVSCENCGTEYPVSFETRKRAGEVWNKRPIEDELHEEIENLEAENARLREALEFYALGKHLLKASGVVVCDAYDLVSGKVENGKYAQEALKGCAK